MIDRKIVLTQGEENRAMTSTYRVVELHGTVEWNIGQSLTKDEVEQLIRRPKLKVVVRAARERA